MLGGGSFAEAERVLSIWLAERPDDARLRFLLGLSIQKQRRYEQAHVRGVVSAVRLRACPN